MYSPSEDSYFFKEFLESYLNKMQQDTNFNILDMGSGSGILAETCSKFVSKKKITCVDIQEGCVDLLRKKGFNAIHSDLFEGIPKGTRYDIILFNAPYLPEDKLEDNQSSIETTGGKRGDEISLKFLKQAPDYLNKDGKILLLISSLTFQNQINCFNPIIVATKKIWFEELKILEISNVSKSSINECNKTCNF